MGLNHHAKVFQTLIAKIIRYPKYDSMTNPRVEVCGEILHCKPGKSHTRSFITSKMIEFLNILFGLSQALILYRCCAIDFCGVRCCTRGVRHPNRSDT